MIGGNGGMPGMMPGGGFPNPNNMNPDQMMAILDNPMISQMMEQMVEQNPDMIRSMLEAQNPMLRQLFQTNPEMANQMVRQMMNPQALRSMLQLQQAMGGTGAGAGMMMPPPQQQQQQPSSSSSLGGGQPGLDFSALLGAGTTGQPFGIGTSSTSSSPLDFASLMQQVQGMQGLMGTQRQQQQQQHPADRYRTQLQSLRDMGFDDEQQCLAVLQQNHGNLNRAVDVLLMGPPSPSAPASAPAAGSTSSNATSNERASSNDSAPSSEDAHSAEPKDATEKKND
jgi:ubiquilin